MAKPTETIACWKVGRWPPLDQAAWLLGCAPGDPFDDAPRPGADLRADSLAKYAKGYGRWLCFLAARGWLDPRQPPYARVTRRRLFAYFHELRRAGNEPYTIIGRFAELGAAIRILAPGEDSAWIRKPGGVTIHALLRKRRRAKFVPDLAVLFDWAVAMMEEARAAPVQTTAQLLTYRNGLLLALLSSWGRRLRPTAALRSGHELVLRDGGHYRIELTADLVKTDEPDDCDLWDSLTPYLRHYLQLVRPALLAGRACDAFWIGRDGQPWTAKGIQERVLYLTRKRFGTAFGPHRFRHAIVTCAHLHLADTPGLGAGLLRISGAVAERHYALAGQVQATNRLAQALERRHRRLKRGDQDPRRIRAEMMARLA
jgi:hypothetical protein